MTDDTKLLRDALAALRSHEDYAGEGQWVVAEELGHTLLVDVDCAWIEHASPDRIARLLDRLEAAERDALRYRLLRTFWLQEDGPGWDLILDVHDVASMDAAIDAAMQEHPTAAQTQEST